MEQYQDLKSKIREIPDFPKTGVVFYDVTPLFKDRVIFKKSIDAIAGFFQDKNVAKVVGIDARGFLVASPVAYLLNAGLVIVRKKGKLPFEIIREYHELEYGRSLLEMHTDAIEKGERTIIIDDVLATGGTAGAALRLVEKLGGNVIGLGFLMEIAKFDARKKFPNHEIFSLITY